MTATVRWRSWKAGTDFRVGRRFYVAALQSEFVPAGPDVLRRPAITGRVLPPAQCWSDDHPAPAPGCHCGWRSCDSLATAAEYLRDWGSPPSAHVFAGVEPVGVTLPTGWLEPSGTSRSSQLEIVGPMLLSPELRGQGKRFERVFGVETVEPTETDFDEWIDALVETPVTAS